ncbi:MAG: polyphosphate kinase 1 [Clostridia bacterium]|nr:polyphosphate kinase 1 [Clostridia bacterium]
MSSVTILPEHYINRELSWLEFNHRVMMQAVAEENPVFERIKFLSIVTSNLDEFFMVRVASIRDQLRARYDAVDPAGMTPKQQLIAISERTHTLCEKEYAIYHDSIIPELRANGILILHSDSLRDDQVRFCKSLFDNAIYPVLTPLAVDRSHPFPLILNKSLNIGVLLDCGGEKPVFATVQVPDNLQRLIKLPSEFGYLFVPIEEIIKMNIAKLFSGYTVLDCVPYRITRNGDLSFDEEEAIDLLSEIKNSLKERKRGSVIRLEIAKGAHPKMLRFLQKKLEIEKRDIYEIDGPINLTFLMKQLYSLPGFEHLKDRPFTPKVCRELQTNESIFDVIARKDILMYHPFDSFDPVVRLLDEAADDPDVLAIKQTLYRVSNNSPIVAALERAADNGKQVTALVEVKARFDEENNIEFGEHLSQMGAHVIYGVAGLKTHSKITLIVRRETDGIKRYLHLGTGNYNDVTARMYTDYSLLTADRQLGEDATVFFNSITGYFKAPVMQKLIMAPHALRVTFTNLIRAEKKKARAGQPAAIFAKMNSLADPDIVRELFKAAAAGVDVRLFVRGICCLRPDVPGLSENVEVRSVVGRFLEHSRVYLFGAEGTEQKLFLSSADWMTRNLDHRVELLFPIEDPDVFAQIKSDINMYWSDTVKSRRLASDGTYHRIEGESINSQEALIDYDFELEEEEPAVYNEDKIIEHPDLEEFPDRDDIGDVLDYDDYHDISHDESLPAYENESEEDDEDEIGEAPFYSYATDSRYDYLDEEEDDDF